MKVVFTCGGTGGHINPALAVARLLLQRRPDTQILFVGAKGGMEEKLVPKEGFRLKTLRVSSYQRSFTPKAVWHNCMTVWHMQGSMRKAKQIIREFAPDVIVGTGGYASYPMLQQGALCGIPTAVHEANAVPGLTTRMVADKASRILVCFEESKAYYRHPERVTVVGMPVREEFIYTKRAEARKKLGLDEQPLLVSAWGSLGAREMNKMTADLFRLECENGLPFRHIHATGSFGWQWMPDYVRQKGVELSAHPELDMREYIYNMPELMAAADLMICRAGASTLNEVAAAGTPCIIVPSPNVTENHQEKNARVLEKHGAAVVLAEAECSGQKLYALASELLGDKKRLASYRSALHGMAVVDSAERIYNVIRELVKER